MAQVGPAKRYIAPALSKVARFVLASDILSASIAAFETSARCDGRANARRYHRAQKRRQAGMAASKISIGNHRRAPIGRRNEAFLTGLAR